MQRAAVLKAGQVQVIQRRGEYLHIVTRDIRGTSELVLPLDGRLVTGEGDEEAAVGRRAYVERGSDIVITETAVGDGTPLSVCRRSLQDDGRMCVDVRKRTKTGETAHMRIIMSSVEEEPKARPRPATAVGHHGRRGEGDHAVSVPSHCEDKSCSTTFVSDPFKLSVSEILLAPPCMRFGLQRVPEKTSQRLPRG